MRGWVNHVRDHANPCDLADLIARLSLAAPFEDGGSSAGPSVRDVLASGVLADRSAEEMCRTLVAIAEANLPVARLLEGHVNALLLLDLHGIEADPRILHGVWGADGAEPLKLAGDVLTGGKRYASGLGIVERAIVSVGGGDVCRLALVEVGDSDRHSPGTWRMAGMRATVSGDVDLTGLAPRWIGGPGDYFTEPYFVGGVWRIAALQLGGTLGLLRTAADELARIDRLSAPPQIARLSPLVGRALAAFGLVERAAAVASGAEGYADPDRAVALSAHARLLTEDLAQHAIAAVERSLGLFHFDRDAPTGRIARDLATYCRQAARDALEQRAGLIALGRPGSLLGLWDG